MTAVLLAPARFVAPPRPTTLASVLMRLNIAVYPTGQVEAFQNKFRRKLIISTLAKLLAGATLALVSAAGVLWSAFQMPDGVFGIIATLLIGMLGLICVLQGIVNLILAVETPQRVQWWRYTYRTTDRKSGVPSGARGVAKKIERHLPDANFNVEWLGDDPFLYVYTDNEEAGYYIYHWDEPFQDR